MTTTTNDQAMFEAILDLEQLAKIADAVRVFAPSNTRQDQHDAKARNHTEAKRRLFAALDKLTPEQARAFGEYRAAALLEQARP